MDRRRFVISSSAGLAALSAPRLSLAAGGGTLKFVPHADLTVIDPTWSNAYVTRNHGYMVFDTLFGQDSKFGYQPQMLESAVTDQDGKRWTLKLRDGLKFHDGSPVLARDCVASLRRWAGRDDLGKALFAVTDELSASDDATIVFRLKRPYPLLPMALGKTGLMMAAIMPERIAKADPDKQITEMVGSGPYRFKADERIAGDRAVYERFADYKPRSSGNPDGTAGPKVAHFDRVEWRIIPDASTAGGALRTGEIDWWELPSADMLPLLRNARGVKVEELDPTGYMVSLRVNHLQGPTANPAIRRLMLQAIVQRDIAMGMAGTDPKLWRDKVGYFCPETEFANDAGMAALTSPRDPAAIKRQLAEAGYKGEKIVLMDPGDLQVNSVGTAVVADTLKRSGFNIESITMDWGTLLQRRNKKDPIADGGWSIYLVQNSGADLLNPAVHGQLRGNGSLINGWCTSPGIEAQRDAWMNATTAADQIAAARKLQEQAFVDVPYIPLGQVAQLTALRADLGGMVKGMPVFWNMKRG
ncbi:ABC transporter substrate-binding protein [Phreatobacter aquaticus]|uniref:ABC transporter substrate-binding protein n=1 Tax=Phreatobacter aquaticus TaxID=2570229 RepID=A0A4D7QFC5_9HYPH|nr:ABC transporter substrate-binding protein [Phreatobacter aquaticus]QCK84489.1 ABC transporter substrate-binding protein [Phreatobacter aquaticus]